MAGRGFQSTVAKLLSRYKATEISYRSATSTVKSSGAKAIHKNEELKAVQSSGQEACLRQTCLLPGSTDRELSINASMTETAAECYCQILLTRAHKTCVPNTYILEDGT